MPRASPVLNGLTVKQERFCQAFIGEADGNASKAYRMAYDAENMSPESVHQEASTMLELPQISLRIQDIYSEAMAAQKLTREWVLGRLMKIAEGDERDGPGVKSLELLGKALGQDQGGPLYAEKTINEEVGPATDLLEAIRQLAPQRQVCKKCGNPGLTAAEMLEEELG